MLYDYMQDHYNNRCLVYDKKQQAYLSKETQLEKGVVKFTKDINKAYKTFGTYEAKALVEYLDWQNMCYIKVRS